MSHLIKKKIMRTKVSIVIISMFLIFVYSCKKNEDTIAYIKVINKTGSIIDTLEVYSNKGNPYSFKYFNLKKDEQTNKETILNAFGTVFFILKYENKTFITSCYPPGIIDPSGNVKLENGNYVFYLIEPDSASNIIPVAFQYEGF